MKPAGHRQKRGVEGWQRNCPGQSATHAAMELYLTPETEAKLDDLARRTNRGTDGLLEEAVEHLVTYNNWFERKVKDSMAAADRGETVPDEEVRTWLEQREASERAEKW